MSRRIRKSVSLFQTRVLIRGDGGRFQKFDGRKNQKITVMNKSEGRKLIIDTRSGNITKKDFEKLKKDPDKILNNTQKSFKGSNIKRDDFDREIFDAIVKQYGKKRAIFVLQQLGLLTL